MEYRVWARAFKADHTPAYDWCCFGCTNSAGKAISRAHDFSVDKHIENLPLPKDAAYLKVEASFPSAEFKNGLPSVTIIYKKVVGLQNQELAI